MFLISQLVIFGNIGFVLETPLLDVDTEVLNLMVHVK